MFGEVIGSPYPGTFEQVLTHNTPLREEWLGMNETERKALIEGAVAKVARELPNLLTDEQLVSYAAKLGAKGGNARAAALTPKQRSTAAKKAGAARWAK